MQKIYTVLALGWGDSEDEFYIVAQCSTRELAEAKVIELTEQWAQDNDGDLEGLELKIESWELDA